MAIHSFMLGRVSELIPPWTAASLTLLAVTAVASLALLAVTAVASLTLLAVTAVASLTLLAVTGVAFIAGPWMNTSSLRGRRPWQSMACSH